MIEFLYAVLLFLVLRFSVTLFNFLSNPKLGHYGRHFTDQVSVVVTASAADYAAQELLKALDLQEYKQFEVLFQEEGISLQDVAGRASGRYLLFLDVQTRPQHGLINNLIYRTKAFNLGLLSIIPTQQIVRFSAHCLLPLTDFLLLNLLPLRLVRLSSNQAFVTSNKECLFFDAQIYRQQQLGQVHRNHTGSAAEIMRSLKKQKIATEVLLGNRMLLQQSELIQPDSLASRLFSILGSQPLVALLYLALVIGGPVLLMLYFDPILWVLPFGLIFLSRIMVSFVTAQQPLWNIVLHPLQMLLLTGLLLKAIWKQLLTSIKH